MSSLSSSKYTVKKAITLESYWHMVLVLLCQPGTKIAPILIGPQLSKFILVNPIAPFPSDNVRFEQQTTLLFQRYHSALSEDIYL